VSRPHNGSGNKEHILRRREIVSRLRVRGLTVREIALKLVDEDRELVDPRTGKPYGRMTVLRDLKALAAEWHEAAAASIAEHKARVLAEIAELKRQGWAKSDFDLVRHSLARECAVLGLDAPAKIAGHDGGPLVPTRVEVTFVEPGQPPTVPKQQAEEKHEQG